LQGTIGRAVGVLELERFSRDKWVKQHPILATAEEVLPGGGLVGTFIRMPKERKKQFLIHMAKTAGLESLFAGAGGLADRAKRWLGRGVSAQWLGPRVAERGEKAGWDKILNPEYYKNEVAPFIKGKLKQFFPKLTKTTGSEIDDLFKVKYKNSNIDITGIKNNVKSLLPESGNPADLLELNAPKVQKDLLNTITNKIVKLKGDFRKANTIWNLRKEIDKTIFGRSWTPDARRYLMGVRDSLNQPLKSLGNDVSEAYTRYAWIKNAELKYGKNFVSRVGTKGELHSPEVESFAKNLLDPGKDEIIKELSDLNLLLPAKDQIMEDLLDYAAAESLERPIGIGIVGRTALGLIGGRKAFARTGRLLQRPSTRLLGTSVGTAGRVGATELLFPSEREKKVGK
jgi:hypothetical protein